MKNSLIYTSDLILCSIICVHSAMRRNIHIVPPCSLIFMLIKLLRKRLKSSYISSSGKRTVKLENLKSAYEPSGSFGRNYP